MKYKFGDKLVAKTIIWHFDYNSNVKRSSIFCGEGETVEVTGVKSILSTQRNLAGIVPVLCSGIRIKHDGDDMYISLVDADFGFYTPKELRKKKLDTIDEI